MKSLLIFVLLFVALLATAQAAPKHNGRVSQGQFKNGKFVKHFRMRGVDRAIINVIMKLRKEQNYQVRLINNAKRRRDRARAARKRQLVKTRRAHASRKTAETAYNRARANEERQQSVLKVKQAKHRAAQKAYYRQHRTSSHAIKQLDAELKILNKIRYLLGAHRITGWRKHRAHRGVRRIGNKGFKNYRNKRSSFHHGKQRFRGRRRRFHISKGKMNYVAAVKYCRKRGQVLGQINSAAQNRAITKAIKKRRIHVWLGINDRKKEGTWVWQNGRKPRYTHWHAGEPNNHGAGEDCAMMYYHVSRKANEGTSWNDIRCNYPLYALCT